MSDKKLDLAHIEKYLTSHMQMSASTQGDFPWIFTAYYASDEDLNIYFLTSPSTIHGTQLATNPNVAVAIAGLQISGLCTQLTEELEVRAALTLWCDKLKVKSPDYSYEGMQSGKITGKMYKIAPKKLKLFDESLQEEGKESLIEL